MLVEEPHLTSRNPIFQDSEGRLRVDIVQGTDISKLLHPGRTTFLTAVEQIQMGIFHGKTIDSESAALAGFYFEMYSSPDKYSEINCLDPWLFALAPGSQEDQIAYYGKVWKLHRNVNKPIVVTCCSTLPMTLRLVTPNFSMLQVTILVDGKEGERFKVTLDQGDEEGTTYFLRTEKNGVVEDTDFRF